MSFRAAIDYLYSLQKHGIKLGLDKTGKILSSIGNPHRQFQCIHIAGTNGKGSVSAMIASMLKASGLRTGLFTSPHLVSFTERIRIDDSEITESEVAELTEELRAKIAACEEDLNPTFFEFITAMAFTYFARRKVEWAVIETGMGGRLDATNVVVPAVSVITRISYDHREFLGESISQIAGEKAGIIKEGVPVVSAPQQLEAAGTIAAVAGNKHAPLFTCGSDFVGNLKVSGIGGTSFDYSNGVVRMADLFTPLAGEYQVINAALAIKAVSLALDRMEDDSKDDRKLGKSEAIKTGLAATRWRGRLELVSADPPVLVDGAHNADAAAALAAFISKYLAGRKVILVLGIMADKDVGDIINRLLPIADETIFTAPAYSRAESPQRLAEVAQNAGFKNMHVSPAVKDAIMLARHRQSMLSSDVPAVIVITGSFYTAGEALQQMGEKSVLSTLRETR
ncbi:MAG: bifunctional folylpolyglutamate synthase/dihydrofolate synthase [Dissulfurispiraceae bacterium]|jgi:dihydrofolate synthase / folylpolyglutamate synthase